MKYQKKPIAIEAIQLTEEMIASGAAIAFLKDAGAEYSVLVAEPERGIFIRTLEGSMLAGIGDYIIRGIRDECYPCKEEIFLETYDPIGEPIGPPVSVTYKLRDGQSGGARCEAFQIKGTSSASDLDRAGRLPIQLPAFAVDLSFSTNERGRIVAVTLPAGTSVSLFRGDWIARSSELFGGAGFRIYTDVEFRAAFVSAAS